MTFVASHVLNLDGYEIAVSLAPDGTGAGPAYDAGGSANWSRDAQGRWLSGGTPCSFVTARKVGPCRPTRRMSRRPWRPSDGALARPLADARLAGAYAYARARGSALVGHPECGDGWLFRTKCEAVEMGRRLVRIGFRPDELIFRRATNRGRTWGVEVTRDGELRLADEASATAA